MVSAAAAAAAAAAADSAGILAYYHEVRPMTSQLRVIQHPSAIFRDALSKAAAAD